MSLQIIGTELMLMEIQIRGVILYKNVVQVFLAKIKSPLDYRQWYYSRIDRNVFKNGC